jgi:hypothetical protein
MAVTPRERWEGGIEGERMMIFDWAVNLHDRLCQSQTECRKLRRFETGTLNQFERGGNESRPNRF